MVAPELEAGLAIDDGGEHLHLAISFRLFFLAVGGKSTKPAGMPVPAGFTAFRE
jgi:hypothetical protein